MVELKITKKEHFVGVFMMYCNDATKAVRRKRLDQGVDTGIDIMLVVVKVTCICSVCLMKNV